MQFSRRIVLATVLAALACLSGGARARELECEVCRKVSRVVEAVLVHNATSSSVFTDVATALCDYLPHTMQPAVRAPPCPCAPRGALTRSLAARSARARRRRRTCACSSA